MPAAGTPGATSHRSRRSGPTPPGIANTADRSWREPACLESGQAPACWDRLPQTYSGSLFPSSRRFPEIVRQTTAVGSTRLAVTGTATGNAFDAANVVTVLQLVAQGDLVGEDSAIVQLHLILRAGRFVAHVKHLVARTKELFRRAMTVQTPFHLQRVGRVGQRHLVHWPVATRTANAFIDMNAVVEINVVRKVEIWGAWRGGREWR